MEKGRLTIGIKFILSLLICQIPAFVGSIFTFSYIDDWYVGLNKPIFTPPNWLFAPIWETIFFMMAFSFFGIWVKDHEPLLQKKCIKAFSVQLAINSSLSILIFVFKSPLLSFIGLIALLISIIFMMFYFRKMSDISYALLYPYLIWVIFETVLSGNIIYLN